MDQEGWALHETATDARDAVAVRGMAPVPSGSLAPLTVAFPMLPVLVG